MVCVVLDIKMNGEKTMLSIEQILTRPLLIIDCLFDKEFYDELIKDKKAVKKFTEYFLKSDNLKELKDLILDGSYAKYRNTNDTVKEITQDAVIDFVAGQLNLPGFLMSPFVKKALHKMNPKNRKAAELLEELANEITYENVRNNLEGHLKNMESK